MSCLAFKENKDLQWIHLAVPDTYVPHGTRDEQLQHVGLSSNEVVKRVSEHLKTASR